MLCDWVCEMCVYMHVSSPFVYMLMHVVYLPENQSEFIVVFFCKHVLSTPVNDNDLMSSVKYINKAMNLQICFGYMLNI